MIKEPLRATAELVARGKDLYRAARCFECHGEDGKGDGAAAADLTDDLKFRPARQTSLAASSRAGPPFATSSAQ